MNPDFNPRSREGSDRYGADRYRRYAKISIHAPARGATALDALVLPDAVISIHAPARGATVPRDTVRLAISDFNPRSREGSDLIHLIHLIFHIIFQSTLPRGERRHSAAFPLFRKNFNPRSREGSDLIASARPSIGIEFQSTLPRGERHGLEKSQ